MMQTVKLYNGDSVNAGDVVQFTNSDNQVCRDVIRKRESDGSLYYWNSYYSIKSYTSARKVEPIEGETYPSINPTSQRSQ